MATGRVFLIALICLANMPVVAASDRALFAFPAATLTISSVSWERPFKTEVSKAPSFRGSVTKEWGTPRDQVRPKIEPMSWQFVGRSDHGDIYVFAFRRLGLGKEIVSVVFDGTTPVVIERQSFRIEISL